MNKVVSIWKPVGLTPLEAISKFKELNEIYSKEKISYAGRLDPMAEGILILLIGDENKKREKYLELDKTYESEIVFGVSTDSYDSLGKIVDQDIARKPTETEIKEVLNSFIGERIQDYPPYSSKTVKGKPLFWWARNNKLNEIIIPKRKIEIYSMSLMDFNKISGKESAIKIIEKIRKVEGDFRQDDIIEGWKKFTEENKSNIFLKIKINVECSSGTYIRSIASELGKILEVPAFAYSIKRVKIGDVSKKDCLGFREQ